MKLMLGIFTATVVLTGCGAKDAGGEAATASTAPPALLTNSYAIEDGTYTVCYSQGLGHPDYSGDHLGLGDQISIKSGSPEPEATLDVADSGGKAKPSLSMIKVMNGKDLVGLVLRQPLAHKKSDGTDVELEHVIRATRLVGGDPQGNCKPDTKKVDFQVCAVIPDTKKVDCGKDGDYGHVHGES